VVCGEMRDSCDRRGRLAWSSARLPRPLEKITRYDRVVMSRGWLILFVAVLAGGAGTAAAATADGSGSNMASPPFQPIPPVVSRATNDFVPNSARRVAISWTGPRRRGTLNVKKPAQVERLVRLLNSLPQEGSGQCSEGFIEGPPSISFSFHSARGQLLGRATEINSSQFQVAWCVPTTFFRPGHHAVRLEGGGFFLNAARRLLRRSLGSPHGA
jgi:hypothetical protein